MTLKELFKPILISFGSGVLITFIILHFWGSGNIAEYKAKVKEDNYKIDQIQAGRDSLQVKYTDLIKKDSSLATSVITQENTNIQTHQYNEKNINRVFYLPLDSQVIILSRNLSSEDSN